MRVLLDECLPARLRRNLPGHQVQTVPQAGWASIKNGRLLRLIADSGEFEIFLTMDKNLPRQQQFKNLPFAIVVLRAKSNRFEDTHPLMPEVFRRLPEFQAGQVYFISQSD
jgi:predicted nuclease of predicted toxin-antitoxin system